MAAIRWWAVKVGRHSAIASSNDYYGIASRQLVSALSKAQRVSDAQLDRVRDPHVRLSLELQRVFGLRREEAIKFQPAFADRGDRIVLKASWTKGGKERQLPVRNEAQRAVLDRVRALVGNASLIPAERSFIQQLKVYVRQTMNAGLSNMHGLRHAYAQQRYLELTGRVCPVAGGPTVKSLKGAERRQDAAARLVISRELGHERSQITSIYLGT
jgi:integrase